MKRNKVTSTALTLEDRKTPRNPNPTSGIRVDATVRAEFCHIEDARGEIKRKKENKVVEKNAVCSLEKLLKRKGAM